MDNATRGDASQHPKGKKMRGHTLWGKAMGMVTEKEGGELVVSRKGKKIGRPEKTLSTEQVKNAIEAARLGIPMERIAQGCGFHDGGNTWAQYLLRHPEFSERLKEAQFKGELELASVVRSASNGWQGSAWLLERTRGYVARAQLDHTTKGKELSVSGAILGAFGGVAK